MGIHGLTTFLRENRRSLSTAHEFPSGTPEKRVSIIVDGWSFIYAVHYSAGIPWVYGGEYDKFAEVIAAVVRAWVDVGFNVHIVFDGPRPQLKFPTQIFRLGQSFIQPSLLFFRTSSASRTSPRFLNEARIIPPLSYNAALEALQQLVPLTDELQIHFADGEGDPYAVELAGRLHGYVVGSDSDFVILNSDGYQGYIPMDEMRWHAAVEDAKPTSEDEGEFQRVRKPKRKPTTTSGDGIIPPSTSSPLSITFTAYSPASLASHLQLPVTLLPLLGALVGNDYTQTETHKRNIQSFFFERQLTVVQRINRVASTIQSVLSPKKKVTQRVESVMDLIDKTVRALLVRSAPYMASGEVESTVEKVVDAALQYAVPKYDGNVPGIEGLWPTELCALHNPETCPILPIISRKVLELEEDARYADSVNVRSQYLAAYRTGHLSPKIIDVLLTGSYWPRLFLENPDLETVGRTIGRPLREWIYAILNDAIGLPETLAPEPTPTSEAGETEGTSEDDGDSDELIDVVESDGDDSEDEDPLAPLKGALRQLHRPRKPDTDASRSVTSSAAPRSSIRVVTEYTRRGTRIAEENLPVKPLAELFAALPFAIPPDRHATPLPLWPFEERLSIFLQVTGSDVPSVRKLPPHQLMAVVALRWVVHVAHARAQGAGAGKERESERWTRREVRCFLATFFDAPPQGMDADPPPIINRNIQLVAQVFMALETLEHLAQTLIMHEWLALTTRIVSGKSIHSYLSGSVMPGGDIVGVQAVEEGLENAFVGEKRQKKRDRRGKQAVQPQPSRNKSDRSLFDLLAAVEA